MRKPALFIGGIVACLGAAGAIEAQAAGLVPVDTIIDEFSNPILSGFVVNDPSAGVNAYLNNTSTAADTIVNYLVSTIDPTTGFQVDPSILL